MYSYLEIRIFIKCLNGMIRNKRNILLFTPLLIVFNHILCDAQEDLRVYSKVITSGQEEYVINTYGTFQPGNLELVIENIGNENIINPRITINDKWNWSTVESIVQEIMQTSSAVTEEEKAMAIWNFIVNNRYHWQPSGDDLHDPIIFLNVYGFAFCGHTAYITDILAKVAGLKSRVWELNGHVVHEVFYDRKWHVLDGQTMAFYLNRDNLTIAGMDEIVNDPWLVERTFHPVGDLWRKSHPRRARDISNTKYSKEQLQHTIANWYATADNNKAYDESVGKYHEMDLTLRPGEKIIFRWDNIGKWYNNFVYNEPPGYSNGKIIYKPDFTSNNYRKGIEYERNVKSITDDGFGPNLHVDSSVIEFRKYVNKPDDGQVVFKVESPYVIVGGKIGGEFYRNDNMGDVCRMLISFNGNDWIPLWTAKSTGFVENYLVIDDIISPICEEPKYKYYVKAEFRAAGHGLDPPQEPSDATQAGLNAFEVETDIQVSPFSIPALSLGLNRIKYTDECTGNRKVRITQKWHEDFISHYPDPPGKPVFPADGEISNTPVPKLIWDKASDRDGSDQVIDYHIQLSLRPDCRWSLCPNLDIDINSGTPEFQIPGGWLISGETYYWRVKAKDNHGNWSDYSKIWKFTTNF